MTSIEQIYEQYSEIEDHLRALSNAGFSITPLGQGVEINLPDTTLSLRLGRKELDELEEGKLLTDVLQLRYHQDCGISFRSYSEFFITIEHPSYIFLDLPSDWPDSLPLRFKIGNKSISDFVNFIMDRLSCFVEEVTAHCLQARMPDGISLTEIPLSQRDSEMPERLQVTLTNGGMPIWNIAYHQSAFGET